MTEEAACRELVSAESSAAFALGRSPPCGDGVRAVDRDRTRAERTRLYVDRQLQCSQGVDVTDRSAAFVRAN
jgi:hypothetical protein